MNGRRWIPSEAREGARTQVPRALSLRGSGARCAGPVAPVLVFALGLALGCASAGGSGAPEGGSLAGDEMALARFALESTADGEPVLRIELDLWRPDGSRERVTRSLPGPAIDGPAGWLPEGVSADDRALITVCTQDATWRSSIAVPLGSVDPRSFVTGGAHRSAANDAAAAAFARYCERLTLHRDPLGGAPAPGGIASAWFGGLVGAAAGDAPPIVSTLADVVVALFARENEAQAAALVEAGWHVPCTAAVWATPRWLALHDLIGAEAFRAALRRLVDEHGGGAPVGIDAVVESFEGDVARTYVATWFRGPARPRVETSWRHDESRGRVLLRVDQTQEIAADVAAAYSFTLPVTIVTVDGDTIEHVVEVWRRRDLFEIPCVEVPIALRVDSESTLSSRVEIVRK